MLSSAPWRLTDYYQHHCHQHHCHQHHDDYLNTLTGVVDCMNHEECLGTNRECSFEGGHASHRNATGVRQLQPPCCWYDTIRKKIKKIKSYQWFTHVVLSGLRICAAEQTSGKMRVQAWFCPSGDKLCLRTKKWVGFQSKCLKEQDVRRCDAGKAVFVFSRFSPRGSASPFNDNIRTNKKHKTSAQSVIAYPKECSSGIIGRGMNNAADSSPVSDLRGKKRKQSHF